MRLNIEIPDDDEQLRAYIQQKIEGQVRVVLREQLAGIVASKIVEMRLTDPNSSALHDIIQNQIHRTIKDSLDPSRIRVEASKAATEEGRKIINEHAAVIRARIKDL